MIFWWMTRASGRALTSLGKVDPVKFDPTARRKRMGDIGWLIVAIVAGLLAVIGWIVRERWIMRRRRRP